MQELRWGTLTVEVKEEIADALWDLQAAISERDGAATIDVPAIYHGSTVRLRLALSSSSPLALASIPWSPPSPLSPEEREVVDLLQLQRSLLLAKPLPQRAE